MPRCFYCHRDLAEDGGSVRAILRHAYQSIDESTGEPKAQEREQPHDFHPGCLENLEAEGRRPEDPATTTYAVARRTEFSAGYHLIVGDWAWMELAAIPAGPGEEGAWVLETLAEQDRDAETTRQRLYREIVAESADLPGWANMTGVGLVIVLHSETILKARIGAFEKIPFESGRVLSTIDARYLVCMAIYDNAAMISPQHAEQTLHAAWTCLCFGPGAQQEVWRRVEETDADGRPTPRAQGIKFAFLAGSLIAARKGRLGILQPEQNDALKTYRAEVERDERTQELLQKMGAPPEEMQAALLLHLADQGDVLRLLALALDGGLDRLALRVRQHVEYEYDSQQESLDPGKLKNGRLAPTEVTDETDETDEIRERWDEAEALLRKLIVEGLKSGTLTVDQILKWEWHETLRRDESERDETLPRDEGLRKLLGVFADDLDRWLRLRDRSLVERMKEGARPDDTEAQALGYETKRQAELYFKQIQTCKLESPHARLVALYIEGASFEEIGNAIDLSAPTATDHRDRIVHFLCRRLMES